MISIDFPECGYTPENLRALLIVKGWTYDEAMKQVRALGFDYSDRTIRRWMLPLYSKGHSDMPLRVWAKLTDQNIL